MRTRIFVFGSNLAGHHGAGSAAKAHKNWGAVYGCGIGLQGLSYAIPTKDEFIRTMDVKRVQVHVQNFINFAKMRQDLEFLVVAIGCGLAGFTPEQIAPMFKEAPANCFLPKEFNDVIANIRKSDDPTA